MIVIEKPTETFTTLDRFVQANNPSRGPDQLVIQRLVVPLLMIVNHELANDGAQMSLAQWHHSIDALLLDRPNEPLRMSIQIGTLGR